jgi:hypothetical protein
VITACPRCGKPFQVPDRPRGGPSETVVQQHLPPTGIRGATSRRSRPHCHHVHQGSHEPRRARPRRPGLPQRLSPRAARTHRPRRPRSTRRREVEQRCRRTGAAPPAQTPDALAALTITPDETQPRMHQVCSTPQVGAIAGDVERTYDGLGVRPRRVGAPVRDRYAPIQAPDPATAGAAEVARAWTGDGPATRPARVTSR